MTEDKNQINLGLDTPKTPQLSWHLPALAAGVFAMALLCFILAFYFTNSQKNTQQVEQLPQQENFEEYDFIGEIAYQATLPAAKPTTEDLPPEKLPIPGIPRWQSNATSISNIPATAPRIAVVIDDLGVMQDNSTLFLDLPAAITFAFLPYGDSTNHLAKQARAQGHEIMIHLPMEPYTRKNGVKVDPGPNALYVEDSDEEITQKVMKNLENLAAISVGVNNHMGSAFTANKQKMVTALNLIAQQKLFFMDSITSGKTQVATALKEVNKSQQQPIPLLARDTFLDHIIKRDEIDKALEKTEKIALKNGSAIAIGHPYKVTFQALQEWVPTLAEKGIYVVPITNLLKHNKKASQGQSHGEANKS